MSFTYLLHCIQTKQFTLAYAHKKYLCYLCSYLRSLFRIFVFQIAEHCENDFQSVYIAVPKLLNMEQIKSFVFFDTETTGLVGCDQPKLTELALIALTREHLLEATKNVIPRVQFKLLVPVNPCKVIHPHSTQITGK